ncbi:hypothetical protein [Paraglaciecola polaris]|uniref:Uncharacterized protein n=1 Tax=Paraglaciecola polaris LMG 21857 TaxID=1129793 RepID=K6YPK2_9ALTE|nr:hypothetical protein [Paraglaciecola polaris]GAC34659.1 hypothetical protein GPLA_3774 [Paraglaciecola polaris LMG 21857]|tara:strand:+ start:3846 stop:4415 length:570 start_codon:yes stop_codon:yes gene_type:complete
MKVILAIIILLSIGALAWFTNQPSDDNVTTEQTELPVITRQDILTASDLVEGVKLALQQHDEKAIDEWLDKAIDLAKEAEMSQQDINYIQSDMAKDYVIFQANRSLFNDAVEQAYYDLLGIDEIKADYPEAEDLFASADKLIAQRDNIIEQIATELADGETLKDEDRKAARQQWLTRFAHKEIKQSPAQ